MPAVAMPVVQAAALYRFFRAGEEETQALRGVSLILRPGELVAVVGPSGSGKSTLLACLAGLDEPDGGTVWLSGQRLSHQPERSRSRLRSRHVGVLYQDRNLLLPFTVEQNVVLAQRLSGGSGRTHAAVLLASLGIAERADAYPEELSGGELARAGLAVALANDPEVVLADEPTGELDTATESDVLAILQARAKAGAAILIASHSPAVATRADRVITLVDGQVLP
ncbi:putative ABC transporter ATP-binding protein [Mycolicibacterium chlorophenolicum]|uniref:Putative ABC transporter ATP-binding protein n=2 Tax=Mycolicibacterium chlorophenolicum TaxID=37916 RepID=A0A0J6YD67_9MYCO|nr:putative ABC transporter ATP-binding protein [Mycolicibacterium chlorophenolicum]